MRRFNYTNLWVNRNLSRHATWHQRSYQIASKQGNQNAQNNMITSFSFGSSAHVTQWSNHSTIKFNTSTGEDYCEWFVCGVCGTEVAFDIKQLSWLHSFLSFFSREQQAAVGSLLWIEVNFGQHFTDAEYTEKKRMISGRSTWSISWHPHSRIGKIAHIEQPNT